MGVRTRNHAHRDDSPGDHDAGQPAACSEAVEEEIRGDLAGGVADEEEARAEAIDGVREVQVAVHLECGEGDVDAVHVGDAVAKADERDQPPGGFAKGVGGDLCFVWGGGGVGGGWHGEG